MRHPLKVAWFALPRTNATSSRLEPKPGDGSTTRLVLDHMLFLLTASKRLPLRAGRNVLGGHESQAPTGHASSFAAIEVGADGAAWISTTRTDVPVTVNGVLLGSDRMPLSHGARIEIGGRKLVFADERAVSVTPIPQAETGAALVAPDGKRYPVPATGLEIGRDPNCDVVLASDDVSRWHAQISLGSGGYQLKDSSTNGVFVNGHRVVGERWLIAGDKVRVGDVQLRFEGGAPPSDAGVTTIDTDQMTPLPSRTRVGTLLPNETVRLPRRGEHAVTEPPLLATLELVSDGVKGKRFRITRPLVHVGRGKSNDVVIPDKSVSSAHARLERRGSDWYVLDGQSKNGTYVDGTRVSGEGKLGVTCEIRFGGVATLFSATAAGCVEDPSRPAVVGIMDARIDKIPNT
ncbi:MAG: FHA domain-containing protein [Gemmatimonadaceae bacterium]